MNKAGIAVALGLAVAAMAGGSAFAAEGSRCKPLRTAGDVDRMRHDLRADYCLQNDIDLSSIGNFRPIGTVTDPFTGTLLGNGFTLHRLRIDRSGPPVGLFGYTDGAEMSDIKIAYANIRGSSAAGILVGFAIHTNVTGVRVSGTVVADGLVGGLAGMFHYGIAKDAHSSGEVRARELEAGGLVGDMFRSSLSLCSSSAAVRSDRDDAGGLVGVLNFGNISRSFAHGPVRGLFDAGGLAGRIFNGTIRQSYARGRATVFRDTSHPESAFAGGLVGSARGRVTLEQVYATGAVKAPLPSGIGGLLAASEKNAHARYSYWDRETTGATRSAAGSPITDRQLKARLPDGFDPKVWAIRPGQTYPYLIDNR